MATHELALDFGAVMLLKEVLPSPQWYEGKPLRTILSAATLSEELSTVETLKPNKGESEEDYAARVKAWGAVEYLLSVTGNQREAVKECVQFYLGKGAFRLSGSVVKLIKATDLDEA